MITEKEIWQYFCMSQVQFAYTVATKPLEVTNHYNELTDTPSAGNKISGFYKVVLKLI